MIIGLLIAMAMAVKELALLVSHIKNNSFPHPLEPEEERECLLRLARGDEEARRILIEHNLRLVAHIVKKYDNTRLENDDLISIGTVGLIKAINTYDLEKGVKLATYAARCIENEILMQLPCRNLWVWIKKGMNCPSWIFSAISRTSSKR